jgi:hypothetical protein
MSVRGVGRLALPDDQRELLAAFGRFLRAMTELITPAGGRVSNGPAPFLLYAMWLRQIQLGRAVQELCIDGFAQEAQMLARAIVGAALDIMLICEQDPDPRALLYASFQKKVRRERSKALIRHGHLSKETATELEHREQEVDKKALAAHAATGMRPSARLGKVRTTWSGLSTASLARRFKRRGWYDLFYSPFSDTAHVNAAAIDKEVAAIARGDVYLGGRFEEPWLVVLAASEAISGAAEQLDTIHSLAARGARDQVDAAMRGALESYLRSRKQVGHESLGK